MFFNRAISKFSSAIMAHVIFPLDSTALGTAMASTHSFSLLRVQDGSQHEFRWRRGQVPVSHSSPLRDSRPPGERMASSNSPVLTLLPSQRDK